MKNLLLLLSIFLLCDHCFLCDQYVYAKSIDTSTYATVIVVAGQSNALGSSDSNSTISIPGCYFWHNNTKTWKTPIEDPIYPSKKGGFIPALIESLSVVVGKDIYVINVSQGGANCAENYYTNVNRNWGPNGNLRQRAKTWVQTALSLIKKPYIIIGTIWLQGESDAIYIKNRLEDINDYDTTIQKTIKWFTSNIGGYFYISLIGYHQNRTLDPYVDYINNILINCAEKMNNCFIVSNIPILFRSQNKLYKSWHYTQEAYDELGKNIAYNMKQYVKRLIMRVEFFKNLH